MPDPNLIKLPKETYIKMVENSEGTRIFNSAFVKNATTGEVIDVLNDGEFSCAAFVSGILSLVGLLDRPHATVATLLEKLKESEKWKAVDPSELQKGDIIFWGKIKLEDGSENEHVGFVLGENEAASTNYIEKKVIFHSAAKIKIEKVYRLI